MKSPSGAIALRSSLSLTKAILSHAILLGIQSRLGWISGSLQDSIDPCKKRKIVPTPPRLMCIRDHGRETRLRAMLGIGWTKARYLNS